MRIYFNNMFLSYLLLFATSIFAEGFIAGTLVNTSVGYVAIQDRRINNHIVCYDIDNNIVEKPALYILTKKASYFVRLHINDVCLTVGNNQQFYCVGRSNGSPY